jgi:hypothetical protein
MPLILSDVFLAPLLGEAGLPLLGDGDLDPEDEEDRPDPNLGEPLPSFAPGGERELL